MDLEDLVDLTLGARFVMVDSLSVDQFSLHYRFHILLQLAMDLKSLVPYNHPSVHLFHGVHTAVIPVV